VRPDRAGFHVSAFGSENILAALSACARHGFPAIEVFADTAIIFSERPHEFRELIGISGVELAGIHSGGTLTAPEYHGGELAAWERVFDWIRDVGADYAVYYGGDRWAGQVSDAGAAARLLNDLGRAAARRGVTFCYEPDRHCPFRTRQSLARLLAATDPALVRLSVDTAHVTRTEIEPSRFFEEHGRRIHVVHVRDLCREDTPDISRDGFVDPGTGTVEFGPVRDTLRSLGYEGWVVGVVARPHVAPQRSVERTARFFRESMGIPLAV
jgi:sugar phosphate isomerase/epimerase